MKTATLVFENGQWGGGGEDVGQADLVLWFGAPEVASSPATVEALLQRFPGAVVAGCSSHGEILCGEALEGGAVAAAISFDTVKVRAVEGALAPGADPWRLGRDLVRGLVDPELRAICFLPATTLTATGFAAPRVVQGAIEALPDGIPLFGGIAGDGLGAGVPSAGLNRPTSPDTAVAVGFYGEAFRLGHGVGQGWDPLGPVRRVTRAEGDTVYELDDQPALDLYLRYSGVAPEAFHASSTRFPFSFRYAGGDEDVIRPVGMIDEARRGLTFIESIPEGSSAQMLHCAFDRLVEAGATAARAAVGLDRASASLALVVSCCGRKAVLGQRILDEAAAVADELGPIPSIGLFSYGELAPSAATGAVALHTESVVVTVLGEAA